MKELYDKIYSNQNHNWFPSYGYSNHGSIWKNLILRLNPKSWLDVGCGHNKLIKDIRENNLVEDSWGIDFSCPGADQQCDILDLPFTDKRWDFITAFDVMEHLYSDQISSALNEMMRVSKRFAFTIDFNKDFKVDGKKKHASIGLPDGTPPGSGWPRETWVKEIESISNNIIWNIPKSSDQSMWEQSERFFIGEWKQ